MCRQWKKLSEIVEGQSDPGSHSAGYHNAWDVFAKVKENPKWRKIPIVFLTAQTDPYSEGFGTIPADDYIEKPFDIHYLKKRIDNVLQRK